MSYCEVKSIVVCVPIDNEFVQNLIPSLRDFYYISHFYLIFGFDLDSGLLTINSDYLSLIVLMFLRLVFRNLNVASLLNRYNTVAIVLSLLMCVYTV